ncbi:MAG TPA: DUF6516 family protein [Candidatus Brocadiales bacterium]|nr:DUF6516 family protein [Candidatus Brocadiales bacterium]
MILDLYRQLKEIANKEYFDIVEDSEIIFSHTGRARKFRIKLVDNTFIDIWYSLEGDYSFHWEQRSVRNIIYRHDNAPHLKWSYIKTFPKHCHDGSQDNVVESLIPDNPEDAMRELLSTVRRKIAQVK